MQLNNGNKKKYFFCFFFFIFFIFFIFFDNIDHRLGIDIVYLTLFYLLFNARFLIKIVLLRFHLPVEPRKIICRMHKDCFTVFFFFFMKLPWKIFYSKKKKNKINKLEKKDIKSTTGVLCHKNFIQL